MVCRSKNIENILLLFFFLFNSDNHENMSQDETDEDDYDVAILTAEEEDILDPDNSIE